MTPDWLTQLAPAHAPPAPGWWPPAPGWWLSGALALLAAAAAAWWWWRDPYRSIRRAALKELGRIREEHADPRTSARAIESVLRRYAMAVFGGERVARLTGKAWLAFVAAEGGMLPADAGRSLLAAAFGGGARDEREIWLAGADAFVRHAPMKRRK